MRSRLHRPGSWTYADCLRWSSSAPAVGGFPMVGGAIRVLCLYVDLVDVVRDVRRLDARSDGVLAALVRRSPTDEWVASLVVVALLALARCRKGMAQVDELIGELAIEGLEPSQRRVANCLLDRA